MIIGGDISDAVASYANFVAATYLPLLASVTFSVFLGGIAHPIFLRKRDRVAAFEVAIIGVAITSFWPLFVPTALFSAAFFSTLLLGKLGYLCGKEIAAHHTSGTKRL